MMAKRDHAQQKALGRRRLGHDGDKMLNSKCALAALCRGCTAHRLARRLEGPAPAVTVRLVNAPHHDGVRVKNNGNA